MLPRLCSPLPPHWGRVTGRRVSAESHPHRSTRRGSSENVMMLKTLYKTRQRLSPVFPSHVGRIFLDVHEARPRFDAKLVFVL